MSQIDSKMSAGTMAGNNDVDDDWVYLDGDQEMKASAVPATPVVRASQGVDESEHCALDLELLAGLDYLTKKKASRIRMDVRAPAPDDPTTEVVATADVVGDSAVDDADAAEDEVFCSDYSNEDDEFEHEHEHGTSDVRLRGLLDNLKTIERKLLDCQRELLDCQKSIEDHRKATRDEAAPAPAPAPSAHLYNARHEAAIAELYASSYTEVYGGKSSGSGYGYGRGGYGTSSGYDGYGYGGGGGYYGGLSNYDYGGGRGGYYRGISGYDYGGLGYYYYPGISDSKYGIGSGSGYRYGGGGGYGGISDYEFHYLGGGGQYSDFDYGGLGDHLE